MPYPIPVVVAIISKYDESGKRSLLLTRVKSNDRRNGMWEFPGGKVEEDESFTDAVIREMQEELGTTFFREWLKHPVWHIVYNGIQENVPVGDKYYILIPMLYGVVLGENDPRLLEIEDSMTARSVDYFWLDWPNSQHPISPEDLSIFHAVLEHYYWRTHRW